MERSPPSLAPRYRMRPSTSIEEEFSQLELSNSFSQFCNENSLQVPPAPRHKRKRRVFDRSGPPVKMCSFDDIDDEAVL